jgi:hypothetical protein
MAPTAKQIATATKEGGKKGIDLSGVAAMVRSKAAGGARARLGPRPAGGRMCGLPTCAPATRPPAGRRQVLQPGGGVG